MCVNRSSCRSFMAQGETSLAVIGAGRPDEHLDSRIPQALRRGVNAAVLLKHLAGTTMRNGGKQAFDMSDISGHGQGIGVFAIKSNHPPIGLPHDGVALLGRRHFNTLHRIDGVIRPNA